MASENFTSDTEGTRKKPKKVSNTSKWLYLDILLIIIICLGSVFFSGFTMYGASTLIAFFLFWVLLALKKLYRKDIFRTDRFKVITGIIRGICYIYAVTILVLPHTMTWNKPWYYPVQKAFYGLSKEEKEFLPDRIPDNVRDYKVNFMNSAFDDSNINMSFFTDPSVIAEYRDKAVKAGATTDPPDENISVQLYLNGLAEAGIAYDDEDLEVYYYPNATQYHPMFYVLHEKTGYVKIYY